jgi:hypothetical protein
VEKASASQEAATESHPARQLRSLSRNGRRKEVTPVLLRSRRDMGFADSPTCVATSEKR